MAIIFNFLKNVYQKVCQENNSSIILFSLVLATVPLKHSFNSIAILLLVIHSIYRYINTKHFRLNITLWLPILFFQLMVFSLAWTIDFNRTLGGLGKELPLLLVPLVFSVNRLSFAEAVKVLRNYSFCMVITAIFLLIRGVLRYLETGNAEVFYYHELSSADLNAIYCSAFLSIALFYFLSVKKYRVYHLLAIAILLLTIVLLSSKTIIIIDAVVCIAYLLKQHFFGKFKFGLFIIVAALILGLSFFSKIKQRILSELKPNVERQLTSKEAALAGTTYNVTLHNAFHQEKFGQNGYFNGTSFRVYQARIFAELLQDDKKYLLGYGFNASQGKIIQKGSEHDVFLGNHERIGYQNMNFHNQYLQVFSELGVAGFLIFICLLIINLKKAVKTKYFVHIAFAILMIALFLTESFIWRQRGVVLFTVLYCLFNTAEAKEKEENL